MMKWKVAAVTGWTAFAMLFARFWMLVAQTAPYVPSSWK